MTRITIAGAQSTSTPGDVASNVRKHCELIARAHVAGVHILVFPELSLSGYELAQLEACAVLPDDACLEPIRRSARAMDMTVVVGAPLANAAGLPAIAALTFFPDGGHSVYCKQYLHPGEDQYVGAGIRGGTRHSLYGEVLAQAICADTSHIAHARAAANLGASLYLAGVLVSETGYATDARNLQRYAGQFQMGVLMANHGSPSGGYKAAGKSAFWASGGELIAAAPGAGDGLLIVSKESGVWRGAWHAS